MPIVVHSTNSNSPASIRTVSTIDIILPLCKIAFNYLDTTIFQSQ